MTASPSPTTGGIRLGLRENLAQFTLLVIVNAFVGAMVGLERSIPPAIAEQEFQLAARTAVLSFIVVFGVAKALTNYGAGRLSDHVGNTRSRLWTPIGSDSRLPTAPRSILTCWRTCRPIERRRSSATV